MFNRKLASAMYTVQIMFKKCFVSLITAIMSIYLTFFEQQKARLLNTRDMFIKYGKFS